MTWNLVKKKKKFFSIINFRAILLSHKQKRTDISHFYEEYDNILPFPDVFKHC